MTRFFYPDEASLTEINHRGLHGLPVLFDGKYRILPAENWYLRERAFREWPDPMTGYTPVNKALAKKSLEEYGRRLQHFRDWCDATKRSWKKVSYDDVITYQLDQATGVGAFRGNAVAPNTANARADIATDFLTWAAARGLRPVVNVPERDFFRKLEGGSSARPVTLKGKVRASRIDVRGRRGFDPFLLPEKAAIVEWLKAVKDARGDAKYLICRLIVQTGMRLGEAVALDVEEWPSASKIKERRRSGARYVDLTLTKTKRSVERTIDVPIKLAERVSDWIKWRHPMLAAEAAERDELDETSPRLFVSDRDGYQGVPIQRHTVYDCFKEVEPRPRGWHPHMARHAYACHFMRAQVAAEARIQPSGVSSEWVKYRGRSALELLSAHFGHASVKTTNIYLTYLTSVFGNSAAFDAFQDQFDADDRAYDMEDDA